jgi:D-tyrosyl-tRNA(Tyr) deacylase
MRAVIQKVSEASVTVEDRITGRIGIGFLVLLGVEDSDTEDDLQYMLKKVTQMRIFEDADDKMNLSLRDVGGSLLIVSQFTLFANTKKGNRPSFVAAGAPDFSNAMYLRFIDECRKLGFHTEAGEFGAHMIVSLVNDGPVTIMLDSKNR